MERKLVAMMAELFALPETELTDSLSMKGTEGWDSLKHMELVVSIEEEFGIELTSDEIVRLTSLGEIKRVLREKGLEL